MPGLLNMLAQGNNEDLTSGVLNGLLGNYDPDRRKKLLEARTKAYQDYDQIMSQSLPDPGPVNRTVENYLTHYSENPNRPFSALTRALGEEGGQARLLQMQNMERQRQAAEFRMKRASDDLKEDDQFSKLFLGGGRGAMGKGPTPEQLRTVYTSSRNEAAQVAKDYTFPNAEARVQWIESRANEAVKNYLENWATTPLGPRGVQGSESSNPMMGPQITEPTVTNTPPQKKTLPAVGPSITLPGAGSNPSLKFQDMTVPQLVKEVQGLAPGPDRDAIIQGLKSLGINLPAPTRQAGPLVDQRMKAQDKGYGAKEGEGLFKERESLSQLHGANSKIVSQLNLLEELYRNPNLPQGELAEKLQSIRSGLKSLGIQVDPNVGPADLALAISTGMSLAQKNADGHNLLPGAMSNYEDQLLQKMAPTLTLTQEGRTALIKFMKEVASSNIRIAQEGSSLASQNGDRLPASWYKRRERVMLEEMNRLKDLSSELQTRFRGNR